jgi:hypothetical protein
LVTVKTVKERKDETLNPYSAPITRRLGVFRNNLLGKSADAKIEAVFGHWVNKVLAFFPARQKRIWSKK